MARLGECLALGRKQPLAYVEPEAAMSQQNFPAHIPVLVVTAELDVPRYVEQYLSGHQ